MNRLFFQRFFSIAITLAMITPSIQAAMAPMAPVGDTPAPDNSQGIPMPVNDPLANNEQTHGLSRTSGIALPKTPITMNFYEADIRDVLRMLALKSGINIIYASDVNGTLTLNLDRVPYDQAFQTVLTLKGLVALPTGDRIIRVVTSTALNSEQTQASMFTRVIRLNYADATDVKGPLDAVRGAAGRKGVTSVDAKTNAIVITDTPEGLQQAEDLIQDLDKKPQQVDIEAKIVEISLTKDTQLGISWSFARTAGQNRYGSGTLNPAAATAPGTDSKNGPVDFFVPNDANSQTGAVPVGTGVGLLPGIAPQVALTFLHSESAFQLAATVSALIDKGDGKVLSNPHILTLNNEEARINATTQVPYRTTTTSSGGNVTDNVQFLDVGIKLSVKPTINHDRRISLKVRPEVSDQASPTGNPPPIRTRNVETTVTLKDGETLAIGGLIQESDLKQVTGVPILMSIPILGYLFKRENTTKNRTELLVFITPRIAGE